MDSVPKVLLLLSSPFDDQWQRELQYIDKQSKCKTATIYRKMVWNERLFWPVPFSNKFYKYHNIYVCLFSHTNDICFLRCFARGNILSTFVEVQIEVETIANCKKIWLSTYRYSSFCIAIKLYPNWKFYKNLRKFNCDKLQNSIWGKISSYARKYPDVQSYLTILHYKRKSFLIQGIVSGCPFRIPLFFVTVSIGS